MHKRLPQPLAGLAVLAAILGLHVGTSFTDDEIINHRPLWSVFETIFCRGESTFECSFDNPISCKASTSGVALTINFKSQTVKVHGVYGAENKIKATTFNNDLNPNQTILFGSGRIIQLGHMRFKHKLEIGGFLLDGDNIAYVEPVETIKRGASGHVLRCYLD